MSPETEPPMQMQEWKDCYYRYQDKLLTIGNSQAERSFLLEDGWIFSGALRRAQTGYSWAGTDGEKHALVAFPFFTDQPRCTTAIRCEVRDNSGLSNPFLAVEVEIGCDGYTYIVTFTVCPGLPFISTQAAVQVSRPEILRPLALEAALSSNGVESKLFQKELTNILPPYAHADAIDCVATTEKHLEIELIRLYDVTDRIDRLVGGETQLVYPCGKHPFSGNMLIANAYTKQEAVILVKEGYSFGVNLNPIGRDFTISAGSFLSVDGGTVGIQDLAKTDGFVTCSAAVCGVGEASQLKRAYKQYYSYLYRGDRSGETVIMSNTWGDRSQDKAICEAFIKQEQQLGITLGIDALQIDDGWETGKTANSATAPSDTWGSGYYSSSGGSFWDVDREKFPHGLQEIAGTAVQHRQRLGLWFSPDAEQDYANWEKDVQTLTRLYQEYGISYFKLDGLQLYNKKREANLLRLLEAVCIHDGNQISVNLDVTADIRLGYLFAKQYGTIFVENRYTDFANYYPHNTLKNLWQLSELIPARKFQFEVLNNRRNQERYPDDPLAPANYPIDYLFAVTMPSNPLIWMEMSGLDQADAVRLKQIISVYRQHKQAVFSGEVLPIGDCPNGSSFTGFQIICSSGCGYLLLFREFTPTESASFRLADLPARQLSFRVLGASDAPGLQMAEQTGADSSLSVRMGHPASYAFVQYTAL